MPNRAKAIREQMSHVEERRAISRLFLTLLTDLRGLSGFESFEDRIVYHAIMDATLAGLMTNPTKIANVTGLARSTVRRHLDRLIKLGVVTVFPDRKLAISLGYVQHPDRMERLAEVMRALREICTQLPEWEEKGRFGQSATFSGSKHRA